MIWGSHLIEITQEVAFLFQPLNVLLAARMLIRELKMYSCLESVLRKLWDYFDIPDYNHAKYGPRSYLTKVTIITLDIRYIIFFSL